LIDGNGARYDLFVSLAGPDREDVRPIIRALDRAGLNLFVDERSIEVHGSITGRIRDGLANSAALLAYYSRAYPTRLACQRELTAAFLAASGSGELAKRILVVNPEDSADHIEPLELRDQRYQERPPAGRELRRWAAGFAERLRHLPGTFGSLEPLPDQRRWWPHWPVNRPLVGRYPELWRLHSALHGSDFPFVEHAGSVGLAVVYGLSGIGKTTLVEQYGIEFAAAFPGGVVQLSAAGGDQPAEDPAGRTLVTYRTQLRAVADWLGLSIRGTPADRLPIVLADHLTRRGQPCLWVIDDVPAGMTIAAVRAMVVPSPYVRTVVTTRDSRYAELGAHLELTGLGPDEALELLDGGYEAQELPEARALVEELGGHPLALRMAGGMLREARGVVSVAAYRHRIQAGTTTVVTDALVGLDHTAMSLLQLTAVVAAAPIALRLMARALARLDGFAAEQQADRLIDALRPIEQRCLAERRDGSIVVHPLVLRAVSDLDLQTAQRAMGAALIDYLAGGDPDAETAAHVRHLLDTSELPDEASIELLDWLATTDERAGEHLSAGGDRERMLDHLNRQYGPTDERTVGAAIAAANSFVSAGDYTSAFPLARRAVGAAHQPGEQSAAAQHALAKALDGLGRFPEAEPYWAAVVAALPEIDGSVDAVRVDRARALRLRGRLDEAEEMLAQVPEPGPPERYLEQAVLHLMHGRPAPAKRAAERAVAGYRELRMEHHPSALEAAGLIVDADLMVAQRAPYPFVGWRKSLEELRQIYERYEKRYGPHNPLTLAAAITYGIEVAGWGSSAAGRTVLADAEREARTRLGELHPHRLRALYGLSTAAVLAGDFRAGLDFAEQAYRGQLRVLGEQHPDTLFSLLQMGVARYLVHSDDEAIQAQRRAYEGLRKVLGWRNHEVWRAWVSLRYSNLPAPVLRGGFRVGTTAVKGYDKLRTFVGGLTGHAPRARESAPLDQEPTERN
jgi:tetratricopeptide (TPR) repeat protein